MKDRLFLALDQGTSSSRAILFDRIGRAVQSASIPLPVAFPRDGWVEQDPLQIWSTQREALEKVLEEIAPGSVVAAGITNQRETVLGWERSSGKPVTPAVVWQCRRSAEICDQLRASGVEHEIRQKTGLVVDAYFSAT